MANNDIPAAVEPPATGGQLPVRDFTPETNIANLETLNNLLAKDTVEHREQTHRLHSKVASMAADFRAILFSSLSDAAAGSAVEMAAAKETAGKILKKAELATAELNAAEMRLLAVETEEDVESDKELVVQERDLSRSDVDEKRKNLLNFEEIIRPLAQSLAHMLKEWEVAEAKCGKLEEELQSVMHEKDLLKRCCEDDKHLAEKLVREVEGMESEKDIDMDILKAETQANGSKISALEEMCGFLKEIRSQLENKLEELKEEKLELVASYSENTKKFLKVEENVKRDLSEFGPSEKEKLEIGKTFDLKEKELKEKMEKMAVEKNLADQRNSNYEIQISNLQEKISELQSARNSLESAQLSYTDKIAAVEKDKNQKAAETVALKREVQKLMKAKKKLENRVNYMNYKMLKAF